MNRFLTFAYLFISLISFAPVHSMTEEEFAARYPWKVDALVYVKKPDGTVVAESIYKDEDALIPQPTKDRVSADLKRHIEATIMEEEVIRKAKFRLRGRLKALLIKGPAGSGKTSLASTIADQMGQPCTFYDCSELIERWRNSASVNIKKILHAVQKQKDVPQIIVFDNLEQIIKRHNDGGDYGALVLCGFLDEFDRIGHQATIIGITNNNLNIPWQLPYRFQNIVNTELPNEKNREHALVYHMKKLTKSMKESAEKNTPEHAPTTYDAAVTAASLAQKTSGLSYYELQNLLYGMHSNASLRQVGIPSCQNKADKEILVKPDDALKSVDKTKPYAALARKITYYSIIGLAVCATLYSFKAFYSGHKSLAPKK